jgi:hypothetical protein
LTDARHSRFNIAAMIDLLASGVVARLALAAAVIAALWLGVMWAIS